MKNDLTYSKGTCELLDEEIGDKDGASLEPKEGWLHMQTPQEEDNKKVRRASNILPCMILIRVLQDITYQNRTWGIRNLL